MTQRDRQFRVGNRRLAAGLVCLLMLGLTLTAYRITRQYHFPGPIAEGRTGYLDFHNGIYFPTRALLRGISPYGSGYATEYSVDRPIPFFSPCILVLHAPLALLPLRIAEILFFVLSIGVLLAIGAVVAKASGEPKRLDIILAITTALVFTRGGHITLFGGYFTHELVLATFLAIYWADRRPALAALALVVVSAKPTYILPLGILMLARGNVKPLVLGAALSIVAAVVPFAWLAYNAGEGDLPAGFGVLLEQITATQQTHMNMPDETPVLSWTRLDLLAVVAKWQGSDPSQLILLLVMLLILLVPIGLLIKRRRSTLDDGLAGMTGTLILTAMLVSIYHQSYDSMLVFAPLCGLLVGKLDCWQSISSMQRRLLVLLMLVPACNFFSTRMALRGFDFESTFVRFATSINGISLAMLLAALCYLAWRNQARSDAGSG